MKKIITMESSVKKFSVGKKLQLALQLYYSAYELKMAALKKFHSELTDIEIEKKVKSIFSQARS
jgi:hypothetical protein